MVRVIVVGGGFSGCGATIAAAKAGAEVILFEKSDVLSGAGLRACVVNANGQLTLGDEAKAMGGGEIFEALESIALHRKNIVGIENSFTYDVGLVEMVLSRVVENAGVIVRLRSRVVNIERKGDSVVAVKLENGERVEADAFIDCSGTTGGMDVCTKYGKGCVMCVSYKCPLFGDRVSIATKAGAPELVRVRPDGTPGLVGAAMTVHKWTLAPKLREEVEREGVVTIPLPKDLIDYSKLSMMEAVRSKEQVENVNLINIGPVAKCAGIMFLTLKEMRTIPGFEQVQIEDPLGGGIFNKINKVSMAPREDSLRVKDFSNLFCAGEKSGPYGGIAPCVVTGYLAGYNAVRSTMHKQELILPRTTTIGDYIAYVGERMPPEGFVRAEYSADEGEYFERMKILGLYTTDTGKVNMRVEKEGLANIFAETLV